ncbi:flagellar FlbD family protein [Treponema porcinum]|uniref:flagellar FlbD family protein n=2 Tax=Treponema porcinum TaxID=261392 RepID=UPI0038B32060
MRIKIEKTLDVILITGENCKMIEVMRLDGKKYWVNPHMIESMEETPDLTLTMLSGKKLIIRNSPAELIEKIISYRRNLEINSQEVL